jgi:hypothetical protein
MRTYLFSCPSVPAPQLLIFHREYLVWSIHVLLICCVSIIIVICICPPGALIWLINISFYTLCVQTGLNFEEEKLFIYFHIGTYHWHMTSDYKYYIMWVNPYLCTTKRCVMICVLCVWTITEPFCNFLYSLTYQTILHDVIFNHISIIFIELIEEKSSFPSTYNCLGLWSAI